MSRLKRKKRQIKRIASEKLEPTTQTEELDSTKKGKRQIEPLPKQYKIFAYTFFGVVLVGVIILILVLSLRGGKTPELPERYEDHSKISVNHYKALVGYNGFSPAELNDDDKEIYEEFKDDLKNDIYIFIYNPDYEECPRCEDIESFINSILDKKENKSYTFLLMSLTNNEDIFDILGQETEPTPLLIHIKGDKLEQTYQTLNDIRTELTEA